MLLRIKYANYIGSKVKWTRTGTEEKGKAVVLVEVDSTDAFNAHRELSSSSPTALFLYKGDLAHLKGMDFTGINLIAEHDVTEMEQQALHDYLSSLLSSESGLHHSITHVFRLGSQISNMRFLTGMCQAYPNIRFTGIEMLDIEGLNRGYADVPKILTGKQETRAVFNGEYPIVDYDTSIVMEVIGEKKPTVKVPKVRVGSTEKKPKAESKPKKQKPVFDLSFM